MTLWLQSLLDLVTMQPTLF